MEKIDFGGAISMPVRPAARERAENFLSNVLGLPQTLRNEGYTCYRFPNGQVLGITPDADALSEEDYENTTWLELVSEDFEQTKKRVLAFGVREVQGGMKGAFFFNLPGGAVVRLVSTERSAPGN